MMLAGGSFELAQARIHARLATRPGAGAWSRLESIRDPGAFLEAASAALPGLAALALSARTPAHTIEQRLIDSWRGLVAEVASWLPSPWRAPVEWLATLPRLPAIVHLERGREARAWMADDVELRPLLRQAPTASTAPAAGGGWQHRWRARLPAMRADDARSLQAIEGVVAQHLVRYAAASPKEAWLTRRQFELALIACLRRHPLGPVPALAFVALSGLDLERFRSELLGRVLFGARPR